MLNMWLVEAKKTQNTALLVELLKVQTCIHIIAICNYILTFYILSSL